jgi:beta-mannosidase
MAPISLGVQRKEHLIPKDKHTRAYIDKKTDVEIWGSNLTLKDLTVDVVVKAFDVITGKETYSKTVKSSFLLPANRSTEIIALAVPVRKADEEGRTVVAAYLYVEGTQIARYVNWPEPLKYVHLQKPKHLEAIVTRDGKSVELSSEVPVKGVALECEDDEVVFGDNLVDVVPGEVVTISVKGASKGSKIETRYLGML